MTEETAIKRQIKDWLKLNDWFVFHVLQGLGAYKGIVDLVAVKNGIVLFVEAKVPGGRQSKHQKKFQEDVVLHGGHYLIATGYEEVKKYIDEIKD